MKTKLTTEQIEHLYDLGLNVINLVEMLSILPKKITDCRNIYNLEIGVCDSDDWWTICYRNRITGMDDLDSYQESKELIDAVYDEIVFLKDNPELKWIGNYMW